MKFNLKKANYSVELHSIFGMKFLVSTKRFFYNGLKEELVKEIESISQDPVISREGDYKIRVVVTDLVNKKSRSFCYKTTAPTSASNLEEIQNEFRERINYIKAVSDIKKNIYRLSVNNHLSNEYDTKCLRFHSLRNESDIIEAIKNRMIKLEVKIADEDSVLVFTGDKPDIKTHRIIITKANKLDKGVKYMNLHSFNVRFPNFSSEEVLERFKEEKNEQ